MRTDPFPPPADPTRPDLEWALRVRAEWEASCYEDLDGPPAEQMKEANAVVLSFMRATQ
jgi:hypothetical protein